MADEIRNGGSKVRVVRRLGHRDNAGAWEIRDFLKRSVVEFQWIELSTDEDYRRELGLSDLNRMRKKWHFGARYGVLYALRDEMWGASDARWRCQE